jgi:hypothetical protein
VKNSTGIISFKFFDIRQTLKGGPFFKKRLKKIQDKKRISRAKAELEKAKRKAEGKIEDEAANILDDAHDEDVLF